MLRFAYELVLSGADLPRPVNYGLVKVVPPTDMAIDPSKRPFIVFDPRAGHGPGIGGMKQHSEIGMALAAGHPCYFVGFTPEPVKGQTVLDVTEAEAAFVAKVVALHPDANGLPCLIGNCQAGWQVMMMAALHPERCGPIVLAGSPLSYWGGKHGQKSLRYMGGVLGGSWMTSLAGDIGNGTFDGAHLVKNFESMNPANTLWQKPYAVWANVDTEAERFLDFERWWGMPVLLEAQEMQFIVDNLFIGNKLTSGDLATSDGTSIDLRNITSPIVVFCSEGDDITPPQQALGWILDLYDDLDDIVAHWPDIIYCLHQTIGHLGIFVSASVARREHAEFTENMDLIDVMPPGLYEAVIEKRDSATANADLVSGEHVLRLERRTLDDIRALGGNSPEDELCFAAAQRVSEINQGFYRTFVSPWVKAMSTEQSAAWLRDTNPYRLRFELFSDKNPLMAPVAALAERARAERQTVPPDNALARVQAQVSEQIARGRTAYGEACDRMTEATFFAIYGSPWLQAMVGLSSDSAVARQRIGRDPARVEEQRRAVEALCSRRAEGGLPAAAIRSLLWIGRAAAGIDERAFKALRQSRQTTQAVSPPMSLQTFKQLVREQKAILQLILATLLIGLGIGIGGASAPVFVKERLAGTSATATGCT